MKKNWIILSVVLISTLAYLDMRERFQELDDIAATTNVQVEMKDLVPKSSGEGVGAKIQTIEKQPLLDDPKAPQKINENTMRIHDDMTKPGTLNNQRTPASNPFQMP